MALAVTSTNLKTRDTVSDTGEYTHTSRDDLLRKGVTIQIHGTDFGASQGNSNVYIADGTTLSTATKVQQTVTSWSNTLIEVTCSLGTTLFESDMLYVFVVYDEGGGGELTSTAHWVTVSAPDVHIDFGMAQIPAACGDNIVLINERMLGYVPKVIHMKSCSNTSGATIDIYHSIAVYSDIFITYDLATDTFDVLTNEYVSGSYSLGKSKVTRATDTLTFTHYQGGSETTSTFDIRYVPGIGVVLDYNSDARTEQSIFTYTVYGGKTVKGDIQVAAVSAETVTFDVEPNFVRAYSIGTSTTTTNSSTNGRFSIGHVDRSQSGYCAVTSKADAENISSASYFGGRCDGAAGFDYTLSAPNFTNHMQLDWTKGGSATNQGDAFFFCAVDLDGYWSAVDTYTLPNATSGTFTCLRDPEFIEFLYSFYGATTPTYSVDGSICTYTAAKTCVTNRSIKKNEYKLPNGGWVTGAHNGFAHFPSVTAIYSVLFCSDSDMLNLYVPYDYTGNLIYVNPSNFGTSTTLNASTYGTGNFLGGNVISGLSIEKLDDRQIITSVKANGYWESTYTYPEGVLKNGSAATITGTGFGASKGTQKVYLADAICLQNATTYEEIGTSSWSATSITTSTLAIQSWMRHTSKELYIIIVNDSTGQTSKAYPVCCISNLDDAHISTHVVTYTGATSDAIRRDYQLLAESSLKDGKPKGFFIMMNSYNTNGLETNSGGSSGIETTFVTHVIDRLLGVQTSSYYCNSSNLVGTTANEALQYSSDYIFDLSTQYGFRHVNHGSSSRNTIYGGLKYVDGSGLYLDVVNDYGSGEGTVDFIIICFYGPTTICRNNTVKASSAGSDDIENFYFGFRPNTTWLWTSFLSMGGYSTSTSVLGHGMVDKAGDCSAYVQRYISSSSQEGAIFDAYAMTWNSTNTAYYMTVTSMNDSYIAFASTSSSFYYMAFSIWRGTLDSTVDVGSVITGDGGTLTSSNPGGTTTNKMFYAIFSDNNSEAYVEDWGPFSIGFAVKNEDQIAIGGEVNMDSSEMFSAYRNDSIGIIPISTSTYMYFTLNDYNYSGNIYPSISVTKSGGTPGDNSGSEYILAALEEGNTYLIAQPITVTASATDATLSAPSGDVITQDATASVTVTANDNTLSLGTVNIIQDATASATATANDTTITGSITITQDATATCTTTANDSTLYAFAEQIDTASATASANDVTLNTIYYLTQDATASITVAASDNTLSASINITQDATASVTVSATDNVLSLGAVNIVQDATASCTVTANDSTLSLGSINIVQDATASATVSATDSTLSIGGLTIAQDATASITITANDNTISLGTVNIVQDATASLTVTANDSTLSLGSNTIIQDATANVSASANDNTIILGVVNIAQDATINITVSATDNTLSLGTTNIVQDATISATASANDFTISSDTFITQDATATCTITASDNTLTLGGVSITQDATASVTASANDSILSGSIIIVQDATASVIATANDSALSLGTVNLIQDAAASVIVTANDASFAGVTIITQDATASVTVTASDNVLSLGGINIIQDATIPITASANDATLSTGGQIITQDATASGTVTASDSTLSLGVVDIIQDAIVSITASANDVTIFAESTIAQDATASVTIAANDNILLLGVVNIVQDANVLANAIANDITLLLGSNTIVQDAMVNLNATANDATLLSINNLVQDATVNVSASAGDVTFVLGTAYISQTASASVTVSANDVYIAVGSLLDFESVYCTHSVKTNYSTINDKNSKYYAVY